MARKSGKELRTEYRDLLDKTKAMQKRLYKRASELVSQYPDVEFMKGRFPDDPPVSVSEFQRRFRVTPMNALNMIERIEAHIASQHPHKQLNIFK